MTRRIALASLTALVLLGALASGASAVGGSLVAPLSACPGQTKLDAAVASQERTMLCMANYARAQVGAAPLETTPSLEESAREKAGDILRCDSFSHFACGREFTYWIRASGYLSAACWRAGENLAFGNGSLGSVRSIFRAWLRSPEHRENVLGAYTQTGIDLTSGTLEGFSGTRVWTQHFGTHCEAPPT
ncbi:MAG TPA: CAP domain-containing protein [Solirubrobacterales bacterium]|nr:CAP domain-containing protein [Solirubrobacterales bacterium]